MLTFASITPHPPIIIPTIGSKEDIKKVKKTIEAMGKLKKIMENSFPETLILVSPHAPIDFHTITIISNEKLSGNFSIFGRPEIKLEFENDKNLLIEIKEKFERNKVSYRLAKESLDHGALVPLFYLTKQKKPKIIIVSYSMLDIKANFEYGKVIGKIIKNNQKRIGFIASGDLSHRLTYDAPAGYSHLGKKFDKKIVEALKNNNIKAILNINEELSEEAGECGLRSIAILLGALSIINKWKFEILSYEGPFGVGYLVANVEGL